MIIFTVLSVAFGCPVRELAARCIKLKLEILRSSSYFIFARFQGGKYLPYFHLEYFFEIRKTQVFFYLTEVIPLSACCTSGNKKSYYAAKHATEIFVNLFLVPPSKQYSRVGRKVNIF